MYSWLLVVATVTFSPVDGYSKFFSFQKFEKESECIKIQKLIEKDALESKSKVFPQCIRLDEK